MKSEEQNLSSLHSALIHQDHEHDALLASDSDGEETTGKRTTPGVCCSVLISWEVVREIKKQLWLSGPLVLVNLLLYSLQLISLVFMGHLGELALSGAAMATSFASVTGFSLLNGLASAMDTLCGQSYGAKQYRMLGVYLQRAIAILLLVRVPFAVIWANTEPILVAVGQEHDIAQVAGTYARFLIPSLFAYGLLQCLLRFLRTQNNV